jgi:hypothetical protein
MKVRLTNSLAGKLQERLKIKRNDTNSKTPRRREKVPPK